MQIIREISREEIAKFARNELRIYLFWQRALWMIYGFCGFGVVTIGGDVLFPLVVEVVMDWREHQQREIKRRMQNYLTVIGPIAKERVKLRFLFLQIKITFNSDGVVVEREETFPPEVQAIDDEYEAIMERLKAQHFPPGVGVFGPVFPPIERAGSVFAVGGHPPTPGYGVAGEGRPYYEREV